MIERLVTLHVLMCAEWTTRKDLLYDKSLEVLRVFVEQPLLDGKVVACIQWMMDDRLQIFNYDFLLGSLYFFEREPFPLDR